MREKLQIEAQTWESDAGHSLGPKPNALPIKSLSYVGRLVHVYIRLLIHLEIGVTGLYKKFNHYRIS